MKRRKLAVALALCLVMAWAAAVPAVTTSPVARVMSVSVADGQIRETPSFLGKIVARADYGQSVEVLAVEGDWAKVALPGGIGGWMHKTELSVGKPSLSWRPATPQVVPSGSV